jgi:DNA-directed RNA polymerase specialized sigma24 family protein
MSAPNASSAARAPATEPALTAAFRDLHGHRLHGFALLVSLGDRAAASETAADALNEAASRLDELEHPERAAAWLRARVLRTLRRGRRPALRLDEKAYRASLRSLGVALPAAHALAQLNIVERAALVAADIERLDPRDVATVVDRSRGAAGRLVMRARAAYLHAFAPSAVTTNLPRKPALDGPLGLQVRDIAGRTLASLEDHR